MVEDGLEAYVYLLEVPELDICLSFLIPAFCLFGFLRRSSTGSSVTFLPPTWEA